MKFDVKYAHFFSVQKWLFLSLNMKTKDLSLRLSKIH